MKNKAPLIFFVVLIILILFMVALAPQSNGKLNAERRLNLISRVATLQMTYDITEHLKSVPVGSIAFEIERLQVDWHNEAESHKRELAGVQGLE